MAGNLHTHPTTPLQESDRIGKGVPPSDNKLGAVMGRRESVGDRAREKGLGKHPIMYEREEETGIPLRDATCFDLQVCLKGMLGTRVPKSTFMSWTLLAV